MKLLVINGNMTQAITDVCANAAREVASPGTEVVSATGTFGPQVIGSRSENALAQHGMLELAAKHAPGFTRRREDLRGRCSCGVRRLRQVPRSRGSIQR